MFSTLRTSVVAAVFAVVFAPAAFAQTGMIKGKVVDAKDKPVVGAKITIEFAGGVNRKFDIKTDKKGEFIQIGLQSGAYKVTATDEKLGTQTFPGAASASARPPRSTSCSMPAAGATAARTRRRPS